VNLVLLLLINKHVDYATLQVRDSFLRSIVSEPKDHNYVYAPTFDRLAQVTKVVLNNTCGVIARPLTTPTTRIPTQPRTYVNGK